MVLVLFRGAANKGIVARFQRGSRLNIRAIGNDVSLVSNLVSTTTSVSVFFFFLLFLEIRDIVIKKYKEIY